MSGKSKVTYSARESDEQTTLFNWARMQEHKYPGLRWMHHIPNGGSRNKAEAARLRAEGVKAGVSDIFLPEPVGAFHGLYIELKRLDGGRPSKAQKDFIAAMREQGYAAEIVHGWLAASELITSYLEGRYTREGSS